MRLNNKNDLDSAGYLFTNFLTELIPRYCDYVCLKKPSIFTYKKLNLRYAIERKLYIHCINSQYLFDWFKSGQSITTMNACLDSIESEILYFAQHNKTPTRSFLKHYTQINLRKNFQALITQLLWLFRYRANAKKLFKTCVFFSIVNEKFIRYLSPIAEELCHDVAYLTVNDRKLESEVHKLGKFCIPAEGHAFSGIFLSPVLNIFVDIVDTAEAALLAIKNYRPTSLVVAEGNAPLDSILSEIAKNHGIRIYCVQQGWSPVIHPGFRNFDFSIMFLWGVGFKEILKPYNLNQKFLVSGNYMLNSCLNKLPQNNIKASIAVCFFLQAPCALISINSYLQFIDLIISCAESFPDTKFIVRNHPSYPIPTTQLLELQSHHNISLSDPKLEPLEHIFMRSNVAISIFSTVLLEAAAVGILPILCNLSKIPNFSPSLQSMNAGIHVNSINEAKSTIKKIIDNPCDLKKFAEPMSQFSSKFFANKNGSKYIAEKIEADSI